MMTSNNGTPQGTVLMPCLFILDISDYCFNSGTCHLQKFSDDSSIVGCITDDKEEFQEPPAAQHWENQRAGSGPLRPEETPNTCFHKRGGGGDGGHLQVPWGARQ